MSGNGQKRISTKSEESGDLPRKLMLDSKRHHISVIEPPVIHNVPIRKSQSFGSSAIMTKPANLQTMGSVIKEGEAVNMERDACGSGRFERNGSTLTTNSGRNPYRKGSRTEKPTLGYVNEGYANSRPSSIHGGSRISLPVIREQYCCMTRWTKLERLFMAIIMVLSFIIICLVITVGVLSPRNEKCKSNMFLVQLFCEDKEDKPLIETGY